MDFYNNACVSFLFVSFFLPNCSFGHFALPPFVNFAFSGGHFSRKGNELLVSSKISSGSKGLAEQLYRLL